MFSARRSSSGATLLASCLAGLVSLFVLSFSTTPASAFLSVPSSLPARRARGNPRSVEDATSSSELCGVKRKVKAEMEEKFSGRMVDRTNPMMGILGNDPNELFDIIEKNKKRAAEVAAAAAALTEQEAAGGVVEKDDNEERGGGDEDAAERSGEEA